MCEERLRILHVCAVGITARAFLLPILQELGRQGYEVWLACSEDADARYVAGQGVLYFPVRISRRISVLDAFAVVRLCRFICARRFHVVVGHTSKGAFVGRLAAWLARVPYIIYTVHGFLIHEQWKPVRWMYAVVERWLGRRTTLFVTVTERVRGYLVEHGIGRAEAIVTIYNGVDVERFCRDRVSEGVRRGLLRAWGVPEGAVVIGTLARLVEGKGLEDLIAAFERVRRRCREEETVLIVGGDGEMRGRLEEQAKRLGIKEWVRFIGWREDVPAGLGCFDVFCLPTLGEGFGYVFMEAQAMGVAVVATKIEPLTETMSDGETALLVKPRDVEGIAEALERCVRDRELREELGRRGCKRVREEFSVERQLAEVRRLYERVRGEVFAMR
ncbi:MAG: glycosyltransferase family 4 protein [bacterium]|nr:glycosyltransferase family 4 protein [bacterium]